MQAESNQIDSRIFNSLNATTGASIAIYSSRKHCEANKNGSEVTFGPATLDLSPIDSDKASSEFQTPEGYTVRITYKSASPTLMSLQLSDKKRRPAALISLAKISSNRQLFLDYLALPSLVKVLLTALRKSFKSSSTDLEVEDPTTTIWNAISSDIRSIRRVLETCPDLIERLWTLIRKDKDRHASKYSPIFTIFKQLSGFSGGSDLIPQCVATFERSVQTLDVDSYELLIQIVPLLTYFDPKYSQYYVSRTNTVEMLAQAFQTAITKKLGPVVFDPLFALVRFFGKFHASTLQEAGIFDHVFSLTLSEEPRIQVNALQLTTSFGIEVRDDSVESLLKSITTHSSSYARVQAALQLEQLLGKSSAPTAMRIPIATALVSAMSLSIDGLVLKSLLMLASLQLTIDECIESGFLGHYQSLLARCLKSPLIGAVDELNAVFEVLLDSIKRTGFSASVSGLSTATTLANEASLCFTSTLLAKIAEIGLYETLSPTNIDPWFIYHLVFWTSGHYGLTSRSDEAHKFFASLSLKLQKFDFALLYKPDPYLDLVILTVLDLLHLCAKDFSESPLSESERVLKHLSDLMKAIATLLAPEIATIASAFPERMAPGSYAPQPLKELDSAIGALLEHQRRSSDPLTANADIYVPEFVSYPPLVEKILLSITNNEKLANDVDRHILQILRSDIFQKRPSYDNNDQFANTVFSIVFATHENAALTTLIGEVIMSFPTLKAPLDPGPIPRLWLIEGLFLQYTKQKEVQGLKKALTDNQMKRLVFFESAILMQLYLEEPSSVTWGTFNEPRPASLKSVRVDPTETRTVIFGRHADFLGSLIEVSEIDYNETIDPTLLEITDAPWWLNADLVSTLLSSAFISGNGPSRLRSSLLKYVDRVRSKLLPAPGVKQDDSKESSESSSPLPETATSESPTAETATPEPVIAEDATPFEKILADCLSDAKAIFGSILNALKDLSTSSNAPSISQLESLRDICLLWNVPCKSSTVGTSQSPRDYFNSEVLLTIRLRLLTYLLFSLNYVHTYDEYFSVNRRYDASWLSDCLARVDPTNFVRRHCAFYRNNVQRHAIPFRAAQLHEYVYADMELYAVFGEQLLLHSEPNQSLNYAAEMPAFDRQERLNLVNVLMQLAMDVIDVTPKHYLPLAAPLHTISYETPVVFEYRNGGTKVNLHALSFENRRNFAFITGSLFKFAAELFGSLSLYPAPSISKPALEWLTTRFWTDLPNYTEYINTKNAGYQSIETFAFISYMGDPSLWIPSYFESWMVLHFHDPLLLAKALRGIANRWAIDPTVFRPQERCPTLYTYTNSLLMRYITHLQDLINNPASWESKNVLSVNAEPSITTQKNRTRNLTFDANGAGTVGLSYTNGFKLPIRPGSEKTPKGEKTSEDDEDDEDEELFTSDATLSSTYDSETSSFRSHYNDTLEWTDWDELEWFTRPPAVTSHRVRSYPLDFDATTVRLEKFTSTEPWESYHPFTNIIDPKSIPKDENERLATINDRLPKYVAALGDAIVAATELLAMSTDERRKKASHASFHPQLIRTLMRIDNLDFEQAHCALESVYVLASHIFCREKVEERAKAFAPFTPSSPDSGLIAATGSIAPGSVDMSPFYLINLRGNLDPKLRLMPELQDFAWKILSVRHGATGASAGLALHNAYTLQALIELELQNSESKRLKRLNAEWLKSVAPALSYYGPLVLHITPSKMKSKVRKALLKTSGGLQKEILQDVASIIDWKSSVETNSYPEYIDFLLAYLRPEDHAIRPRLYDIKHLENGPLIPSPGTSMLLLFMHRMWSHATKLIHRATARLCLFTSLTRGIPDFPWDEHLYAPIEFPRLTSEERTEGTKRFEPLDAPAQKPEWAKESDRYMTNTRKSYHLPIWPIPEHPFCYHTANVNVNVEEQVNKNATPTNDWRHAMEAPSFFRLVCAMDWIIGEEKEHLVTLNWGTLDLWKLSLPTWALLVEAVSTPLHAVKFITDPFYLSYLQFMAIENPTGPLELRLGNLLTRTGLFESPELVTPAGLSTTPAKDIIDEKRGTIILGLGSKKAMVKNNRYLESLRTSLRNAFKVIYQPFSTNFAPLIYATMMTHDHGIWFIAPGNDRRLAAGPGIMWGIHLDLIPNNCLNAAVIDTRGLLRYKDETMTALHALRCQAVFADRKRVPLPEAYPLLSGAEMSDNGASSTSSSAPSSSSTSSKASDGEVAFAPLTTILNDHSRTLDGYELKDLGGDIAPLSQLPTLFATARQPKDDPRAVPSFDDPSLNGSSLISPHPFILMSQFKMVNEADYNPQGDYNWPCKRLSLLGVNAVWVPKIHVAMLPRFTANTKPYFKSNGVTGAALPMVGDARIPHDLKTFPNADATEPAPFTPLLSFYALPYNRVVNVWYPQFATTFSLPKGGSESSITRFVFTYTEQNAMLFLRIGMATRSAIAVLNANPLFGVGEVPGSFSFSFHEAGLFEQGKYSPTIGNKWLRLRATSMGSFFFMDIDKQMRIIQYHGDLRTSEEQLKLQSTTMIPDLDPDEEYLPVLSFYSATNFQFNKI